MDDYAPGYWMHETSGVLRPAIEAYLLGTRMTLAHVAAMRDYLRQWIAAPGWRGPLVDVLRSEVDDITTRDDIEHWLDRAMDAGIDPL